MAIQKVDKDEQDRIKRFLDKTKYTTLRDELETGLRYMSGEMGNPNGSDSLDGSIGLQFNDINKYPQWVVSHITQNPYNVEMEPREDDPFDKAIAESLQEDLDLAINSPDGMEAIESAFMTTASVGYGYVPFELAYLNKRTTDQTASPIIIRVPYDVLVGNDDSIDGSGLREACFRRVMDKDQAEQLCGKANIGLDKYADWQKSMFRSMKWDSTTVPDITFLYLTDKSRTQYHDADGNIVDEKQFNGYSREVVDTTVHIARYIGAHRYEYTTYKSDRLPLACMRGFIKYRSDLGDAQYSYIGYYQKTKDYQEALLYLYNEAIAIASRNSKAPYTAYEGQLEGREDEWQNSNTNGINVLLHKPVIINGVLLPPPARMNNQSDVAWILAYADSVKRNMEGSIGINDVVMGLNEGFRETNKAVELRSSQGGMTVAPLLDNCEKAIINMAKIVTDLAIHARPKRLITWKPEDQEEEVTKEVDFNDLGINHADFIYRPTQGPANESKRQQELNWLLQIGTMAPQIFPNLLDLVVKRANSSANDEIIERIEDIITLTNPDLIRKEGQEKEDPKAIEALQMMQSQIEQAKVMLEQSMSENDQLRLLVNQLSTELQKNEAQAQAKVLDRQIQEQAETDRNTQDNMTELMVTKIKEGQAVNTEIIKQETILQQKDLELAKSAIEALQPQETNAISMRSPAKGGLKYPPKGQNPVDDENEKGNLEATQ